MPVDRICNTFINLSKKAFHIRSKLIKMSGVVNRKTSRSQTPTKARKNDLATAIPVEQKQEAVAKRASVVEDIPQTNADSQVEDIKLLDHFGTWNTLIYFLVSWSAFEGYYDNKDGLSFEKHSLTFLHRLFIIGSFVLFGTHLKKEVCKDKSVIEWYKGFRRSFPYSANVFEGVVVMIASQLSLQIYKNYTGGKPISDLLIDRNVILNRAIVSAFYVTPVLTVFFKWMSENWTLGGNWGNALFNQLVFSPIFTIFLIIFMGWAGNFINRTPAELNIKDEFVNIFKDLNGFPLYNDNNANFFTKVVSYLKTSKQAISFAFWFPQTLIANFWVPAEYTLLFSTLCTFVWNIIFELFIKS